MPTVWKSNWKRRHNITITIWSVLVGLIPSVVIFSLTRVWWKTYTVPLFGLTIGQIMERPALDTVFGIAWFFVCPELCVVALVCIVAGFRIFMERE